MSFVRHSVAKVEMVFWLSTTRSTGMGQTGVASSRQRDQLMHDIYRALDESRRTFQGVESELSHREDVL